MFYHIVYHVFSICFLKTVFSHHFSTGFAAKQPQPSEVATSSKDACAKVWNLDGRDAQRWGPKNGGCN
jgi:hypothetical protein